MASALFGVNPISYMVSELTLYNVDAASPTAVFSGKTTIPSWLLLRPISSSAHIIPCDSTPLIVAFLIFNGSFPIGNIVVPGVATSTFWFSATFGAPQIICCQFSSPIST